MVVKKTVKADVKKTSAAVAVAKKPVKAKKAVKAPASKQKTETPVVTPAPAAPVASIATALPTNDVTYVIIDYPTENETISGIHYAIRIGASSNGTVELSINNGPWEPCRYTDGYWWYDWGYYLPGPCKISARLLDDKGKLLKRSSVRKCTIV